MASSVVVITLDGPASAGRAARLRLVELEALWSRFAPGSDIDRLNRAAGAPVPVSRATITLLNTMVEAAKSTDGRFDPTMLPALIDTGYRASIDDADRITTLSPGPHRSCVGLEDVVIDADDLDTNGSPALAFDVGVLSGDPGTTGTRTCGNEFFAATNVAQAGGVARMAKAAGFRVARANTDTSLGVKITTAAGTQATSGKVGISVFIQG